MHLGKSEDDAKIRKQHWFAELPICFKFIYRLLLTQNSTCHITLLKTLKYAIIAYALYVSVQNTCGCIKIKHSLISVELMLLLKTFIATHLCIKHVSLIYSTAQHICCNNKDNPRRRQRHNSVWFTCRRIDTFVRFLVWRAPLFVEGFSWKTTIKRFDL